MPSAQNDSELYVAGLSQRSFLSLWSYANPTGKKGKELCDLLVVCGNDVAIVSVKDIRLSDHADERVRVERWATKALDGSFKQIAGAERWLRDQDAVTDADGARGVALPPVDARRVHRVALAFGGQGQATLPQGDRGDGFVHSMDEGAFDVVIRELDTATDFFAYLRRKERFLRASHVHFEGQEEDLLAFYLMNGRSFPGEATLVVLGEGLWDEFQQSEAYAARAEANAISVVWDRVIEEHIEGLRSGPRPQAPGFVASATTPLEGERVLRVMAQEDRYWRRALSEALVAFVRDTSIRARMAISPERRVTYVFLRARAGEDVEDRAGKLLLRCLSARSRFPEHPVVIGMTVGSRPGDPMEMMLLDQPEWSESDEAKAELVRREMGYFATPRERRMSGREFPVGDDGEDE